MDFVKQLPNVLFIDIQTVTQHENVDALSDTTLQLWQSKASTLKVDQGIDPYFTRANLYAEYGQICSIGLGLVFFDPDNANQATVRIKTITSDNEKDILQQLKKIIDHHKAGKNLLLCAHNGKEFDIPYICRRMIINNITLPKIIDISGIKPWANPHLDTMELWRFGDSKYYISLDLLGCVLGIDDKLIETNEVNKIYHTDPSTGLNQIAELCKLNTLKLIQVYLRLNNWPVIDFENVYFT